MHPPESSSRRTVLVLCFGNLCRSPMAEALLGAALPHEHWQVVSAGTHALEGSPPTRGARNAVHRVAGIDISGQRSTALTVDVLRNAAFIFAMSRQQAREAAALHPAAAARIRLLGAFAPAADGGSPDQSDLAVEPDEIADPMGGDDHAYAACCRRIAACTRAATTWLLAGADETSAPAAVAAWRERP